MDIHNNQGNNRILPRVPDNRQQTQHAEQNLRRFNNNRITNNQSLYHLLFSIIPLLIKLLQSIGNKPSPVPTPTPAPLPQPVYGVVIEPPTIQPVYGVPTEPPVAQPVYGVPVSPEPPVIQPVYGVPVVDPEK